MECTSTSVEVQTIIKRIEDGDINLQPQFQRGEVWSSNKQRKLIDTLLRGWSIPPIHVVERDDGIDEVLDGQQRLVSIKDFYNNKFAIDGNIPPFDSNINKLNGVYFKDLPQDIQRRLNKSPIVVVRLSNYEAEEPAELFFRLNQPVPLTAAEQRNAFMGKTRTQIKELVNEFEEMGAEKASIGFSNSRLAYDEIISKFVYLIEEGSLKKKISSNDISLKYRGNTPFSDSTIENAHSVLVRFMNAILVGKQMDYSPKFSKATLFSWLIFLRVNDGISDEKAFTLMSEFEQMRDYLKGKQESILSFGGHRYLRDYSYFESMINLYNQRASMASTDALSIIYRDVILNIFYDMKYEVESTFLKEVNNCYNRDKNFGTVLDYINATYRWGEHF